MATRMVRIYTKGKTFVFVGRRDLSVLCADPKLTPSKDGGWIALNPFTNRVGQGETKLAATISLEDVLAIHFDAYLEQHGDIDQALDKTWRVHDVPLKDLLKAIG